MISLIGVFIVLSLWLGPAWRCRHLFDKKRSDLFNGILACMIAFSPNTLMTHWWTGKGVIISGFVIASLLTFLEMSASNEYYGEQEEMLGCIE